MSPEDNSAQDYARVEKLRWKSVLKPVYEDSSIIAFDKPSGMLAVPDRWDRSLINLMDMVHEQLSPNYSNVYRLDKDTSGLLVCAKDEQALKKICLQFENRERNKTCVAITRGMPPEKTGTVDRGIEEDPLNPGRMKIAGKIKKKSITLYEVKETFRGYALVELAPLTSRMHQLRLHMAYIGCPIAGDMFYGDGAGILLSELKKKYKHGKEPERPLIGRLALHEWKLSLKHPAEDRTIELEAPIPHDFEVALKYLRKFA